MSQAEILVRIIAMDNETFSLDIAKYKNEIKAAIRAINVIKNLSAEQLSEVENELNSLVKLNKK